MNLQILKPENSINFGYFNIFEHFNFMLSRVEHEKGKKPWGLVLLAWDQAWNDMQYVERL